MKNEDFEYLLSKPFYHLPEKSILSQSFPLLLNQVQHQLYQLLMTQVPLDLVQFLSGPRAESAGAVTGRRCPHSGEGEDFLSCKPGFFYENCWISGTECRKIDPKVGNERPLRGLQMGC